jgi:hypothetical protein
MILKSNSKNNNPLLINIFLKQNTIITKKILYSDRIVMSCVKYILCYSFLYYIKSNNS